MFTIPKSEYTFYLLIFVCGNPIKIIIYVQILVIRFDFECILMVHKLDKA